MKHKFYALGRLKTGELNKMEMEYAQVLDTLKITGDVLWYKFDGVKFRLADNTFYSPDFCVMTKDGQIEFHEVKGFWLDDARVKIKVAADMYPFKFIALTKKGKEWKTEEF